MNPGGPENFGAHDLEFSLDEALKPFDSIDAELVSLKDILKNGPELSAGKTSSATYLKKRPGDDQRRGQLFTMTRVDAGYDD